METLIKSSPSPSPALAPAFHHRAPSFPTLTHRPIPHSTTPLSSAIDESTPSSPLAAGTDNIPCGPAPSSPLHGGGVEALRASRQGSIPWANGGSLPYGNLSLAAASVGGGAPGSLSPPGGSEGGREREKEKEEREKKGLYPSRVVLTSQYWLSTSTRLLLRWYSREPH